MIFNLNIFKFLSKTLVLIFVLALSNINAQVNVSLPDTSAIVGDTINIPIYVDDLSGHEIYSYYIKVRFKSAVLKALKFETEGTLSELDDWSFSRTIRSRTILVKGKGNTSLSGSGALLYLKFLVKNIEDTTSLTFDNFYFNNYNPTAQTQDGSLFTITHYNLTLNLIGNGSGRVKIDEEPYKLPITFPIFPRDTITIEAVPDAGNNFGGWSGDYFGLDNPTKIIMDDNKTIDVIFLLKKYTISANANPDIGGFIVGDGEYLHGEEVNLIATPDVGWSFLNWTEEGQVILTDSIYTFIADKERNLIANFEKLEFEIICKAEPNNSGITEGGGIYKFGDTATVKAISEMGWTFINWTEKGFIVSNDSIYNFVVEKNRNLIALFSKENYQIICIAIPSEGGITSGCGSYFYNQLVTLTALSNPGWSFVNWTEDGVILSTDSIYSFNVTRSRNVTANFSNLEYEINCNSNPSDGGLTTGNGIYYYGQNAVLSATPYPGRLFINWTENEDTLSTSSTYSFIVTENKNITANFSFVEYLVNCSPNPTSGGMVYGNGIYTYGQIANLSAIPNSGWNFINWTEGDNILSTEANYSIEIKNDLNIIANFDIQTGINDLKYSRLIPDEYFLSNNYPNPFNPSTFINFGLIENSSVSLKVVDINGRIVNDLISNQSMYKGSYQIRLDGSKLASGIYIYVFFAKSTESSKRFRKSKKMILLK
jgi:hypothetical protein